jgi:hypothetical protein
MLGAARPLPPRTASRCSKLAQLELLLEVQGQAAEAASAAAACAYKA